MIDMTLRFHTNNLACVGESIVSNAADKTNSVNKEKCSFLRTKRILFAALEIMSMCSAEVCRLRDAVFYVLGYLVAAEVQISSKFWS